MIKTGKLMTAAAAMLTALAGQTVQAQTGEADMQAKIEGKVLIAYFSRAGENYGVGRINQGNTSKIAKLIAQKTQADVFEINPVKAYPENYRACTEVAKTELEADARPAIQGTKSIKDYDTVLLGYPIWWGDMPMAVYTFLEQNDWTGKTVVAFSTNEGSGLGVTQEKLREALTGAKFGKALSIRGTTAQSDAKAAERAVDKWLTDNGFALKAK